MTDSFEAIQSSFYAQILFSIICGFIVGLERQIQGKPTGIRTCTLICLGSMAFIHLGQTLAGEKDAARVLGQVVTGIGFLGAGTIMNKEGLVVGITSAAVVWMLAAIGAAIGFGYFGWALSLSITEVLVLTGMPRLEARLRFLRRKHYHRHDQDIE